MAGPHPCAPGWTFSRLEGRTCRAEVADSIRAEVTMQAGHMRHEPSIVASAGAFWRDGAPAQRVGYVVGALLFFSGLLHLAILATSGGSWYGPVLLRQSGTFGLSFGRSLVPIVWVVSLFRVRARASA